MRWERHELHALGRRFMIQTERVRGEPAFHYAIVHADDSQWWLHGWPFPTRPEGAFSDEEEGGVKGKRLARKRLVEWVCDLEEAEARRSS